MTARWSATAAVVPPAALVVWLLAAPLSTGAAEILLGLALVTALLARATGPQPTCWPRGWRSPLTGGTTTRIIPWLWLAFVVWYVVSVAAAVDPATSAGKLHKLFRYALFFVPLAVPWRDRHWRAAFWILLPLLAVLSWEGVASLLQGWRRAQTPSMHYNTLAQVAAMISLLLLAAWLFGPPASRRQRLVFLLGCAGSTALMIATFSRAAWIAWWLGACGLILVRLPRRIAWIVVAVLALAPLIALPLVRETRSDVLDLRNPEFTRRYDMWRMAAAIIADHSLTGIGPGGMGAVYDDYKTGVLVDDPEIWVHVHNDVLGAAISHGLPAAAIWIALVVALYVSLGRRLPGIARVPGSWLKAGYVGTGASLHLFYLFGLVHENHPIYIKSCLLLLLSGLFVAADRRLGSGAGT